MSLCAKHAIGNGFEIIQHELRVGNLRIFYRVEEERVQIEAIGRKIGNKLWIGEEEISL